MAQIFVFANNVNTTLAAPISSTSTTITLSSDANFPVLSANETWALTLNDAATQTIFEIVYVTAVSGTTVTVIRGQEGTSALSWVAGDYAFGAATAGEFTKFVQASSDPVQQAGSIDISGTATASEFIGSGAGLTDVPTSSLSGDISLTSQISGILPVSNGGSGTTTPSLIGGTDVSITGTWPNQTVSFSATGSYVESVTASSPIASSGGQNPNISLTGIVPIANGGTGTGSPALVPGTDISITGPWPNQTISWTGATAVVTSFSAGTTGLTPATATAGAVTLAGVLNAANGGTGIDNGSNTITLGGNVSTAGTFSTSGTYGLTLTATGATNVTLPTSGTLVNTAVTTLSSLSSVGTITSGTWNGTTIATAHGGTGLTSFTSGGAVYAASSSALTTGTLPVASGGTGATTLTGYLIGNGTSAVTASTTIPTSALSGNFVSTFSGGSTGLTPSTATAGAITLGGTLAIANGGTGTSSPGTVGGTGISVSGSFPTQTVSITTTGVSAGSYGSASVIPVLTVNAEGQITAISTASTNAPSYQGTWNANTNNPTLTSSVGTQGFYYVVSTAGSTNLDGITDWNIGDWAIFSGGVWEKIPGSNSEAFTNLTTTNLAITSLTGYVYANGSSNVTASTSIPFSAISGTVSTTNAATFNNSGTGAASGSTFNGSATLTVSYNTVGASPLAGSTSLTTLGTVTTGTWAATTIATNHGGTGLTSFTANGAVYATSTAALTTGTLPIASGGTNSTATPTAGSISYGNGTSFAFTSAGTSGQPLISGGSSAPAFGTIALGTANTNVSGTLTVTNGGTGASTLTGYVYGNGTSAMTASTTIPTTALSGTITNAQLANSSLTVNGTAISLGGSGTVTAAAGTLTGTTLNSTVTGSSLTSVGTITSGTWNGGIIPVAYGGTGTSSPGLIQGANITISGSWPNQTIAATGSTGVSSVTASSPLASSGGSTPNISFSGILGISNGGTGTASPALVNGTNTSVSGTWPAQAVNITAFPASSLTGTISLTTQVSGTLPVANGGTGVTTSSGASSVVLRDSNANITTNALFEGYTNQAAGTAITLTASSTPNWIITGSGGQTITLPNATTLPIGAQFTFNNNQTSGTITVNNTSSTLVVSVASGAFSTVTLLSNGSSAGTWDLHFGVPSNTQWSTNTFQYPGTITQATWNGVGIGTYYGGTGLSGSTPFTSGGAVYASSSSALTTGTLPVASGGTGATTLTGYLIGNGTSAVTASTTIPTSALSGTISNTQLANSSVTVNGTAISLGGSGTVTAAAGTLTGITLNSTVTGSSLTSVGTITSGTWNGTNIGTAYGGTGLSGATPFTSNGAVYATSTSALTTGTLPINAGGTNSTATPTAGGVGYGTGTAHAYTSAGTSGQPLLSAGASAPAFGNLNIGTANTNVTGTLTGTNGGTGVNNGSNTITLGGNINTANSFTTSGNFALTLTTTAATNVTLPTTGTLINTAVTTLSSLASIGTITTGVWNGTTIAIANGGTGQTSAAAAFNALSPITSTGDLIIGSGTNTATRLGIGANTYVLTSNGTTATWAAPSGGTTTNSLTVNSGGSGGSSPQTFNGSSSVTISYNTIGASPLAGSTSLTTVGTITSGTWNGTTIAIANGGTGQTSKSAAFNALSPITATGDLIIGNGTNSATNLAIGANTYVLTSNGTTASWAAPTGGASLSANNTWTGTQTFSGTSSVLAATFANMAENITVSATAATGTINLYTATQSILYYTTNATGNFTINVAHSSGTTLNTAMATGTAITVVFMNTNGTTAYYCSAMNIDGTAQTVKWLGNIAPAAGNPSLIDFYTFTIIKTGSATYTVFGSMTTY